MIYRLACLNLRRLVMQQMTIRTEMNSFRMKIQIMRMNQSGWGLVMIILGTKRLEMLKMWYWFFLFSFFDSSLLFSFHFCLCFSLSFVFEYYRRHYHRFCSQLLSCLRTNNSNNSSVSSFRPVKMKFK
ncbi:uncharacterized protein MELLADRAFT_72901 [Melampsora larici-populina 98AG31]|uniref:Uncharacterized protein n=1 Tax=Melampsora larici-populina (strain 98AG31 / pathotype 3-4-7) TaxID=747676 RepID=F4S0H2_MELLP|nr:uncharacterized protein MELLADRAFT_72901 [Melampsora larici-populina 98AG31]EGG01767.1 hypothetical protein MELLADRAFT_72901 [Melampsora larici-populina 98AG31]